MTDLEQRFVQEYCKDCKGAKAAVRAGYERSRARQTAWELKQIPEIKAAITERLKYLSLDADEATKNVSDIARTRINDFMSVRYVQGYESSEQYVTVLLQNAYDEIERIRQFMKDEGLEDKGSKSFKRRILKLQEQILDYQSDIERYGNEVTRLVAGKPRLTERVEIDLVAIAKAKELGNVQELSFTEFGPKIKMYAADKANETILKLNGRLIERKDITSGGKSFGDFLMEATDE